MGVVWWRYRWLGCGDAALANEMGWTSALGSEIPNDEVRMAEVRSGVCWAAASVDDAGREQCDAGERRVECWW